MNIIDTYANNSPAVFIGQEWRDDLMFDALDVDTLKDLKLK